MAAIIATLYGFVLQIILGARLLDGIYTVGLWLPVLGTIGCLAL